VARYVPIPPINAPTTAPPTDFVATAPIAAPTPAPVAVCSTVVHPANDSANKLPITNFFTFALRLPKPSFWRLVAIHVYFRSNQPILRLEPVHQINKSELHNILLRQDLQKMGISLLNKGANATAPEQVRSVRNRTNSALSDKPLIFACRFNS
jgi:hypothetical protein